MASARRLAHEHSGRAPWRAGAATAAPPARWNASVGQRDPTVGRLPLTDDAIDLRALSADALGLPANAKLLALTDIAEPTTTVGGLAANVTVLAAVRRLGANAGEAKLRTAFAACAARIAQSLAHVVQRNAGAGDAAAAATVGRLCARLVVADALGRLTGAPQTVARAAIAVLLAGEAEVQARQPAVDNGAAVPASVVADLAVHTLDGAALGTPEYMSPEQIRDAHDIDGRSDLFSLAIVLYEAMTGVNPFRVPSAAARIGAVLEAHVDPDPRIPPRVWVVLARALAKRANERPANAGEFRAALEAASDATPGFREASLRASVRVRERVDQPLRVGGGEPFRPSKGTARARRRWLALAIGSGLVTSAAAGAWLTRPAERSPLASAAQPSFGSTRSATIAVAIAPPDAAGAPAPTAPAQAQIASVRAPERAASAPRAAAETQRAPAKPKPVATTPGF